jgi:hypothetical protein
MRPVGRANVVMTAPRLAPAAAVRLGAAGPQLRCVAPCLAALTGQPVPSERFAQG